MSPLHPAAQLLLLSALMIFWLIPLSSWLMLSGQRDRNANLWFFGTGMYSVAVSLFVFNRVITPVLYGPMLSALALLAVLLLVESMRRELPLKPVQLWRYGLVALAYFALLVALFRLDVSAPHVQVMHWLVLSALEIYMVVLCNRVRRKHRSQALWVVMAMFSIFVLSNLSRVAEWWQTGRISQLLDFTAVSNVALMVNNLSAIFYCYGYWGFVLEKNRELLVTTTEQTVMAREAERQSSERERLTREAWRERTELMERLTLIGRQAQAGAMSASIAHEVNQPLAAIQLNVEEAQRMAKDCPSSEGLQRLLVRIEADNQRAAEIVQRVRALFNQSQVRLRIQVIDDMVRFVTDMLRRRIQSEAVKINLSLKAPQPFEYASGEVEHVLMNLLENALDALSALPPHQRQIDIATWEEPGWVMVSVADNGPGIAADQRERIFDLYQTSKPQGLGLGLWLAYYIVERHGAQLVLDTAHAPGARFVLRLPKH